MKPGHFFMEISKRRNRFGTSLDFIEEQQCLSRLDPPGNKLQCLQNALGYEVGLKMPTGILVQLKIHRSDMVKLLPQHFFNKPCLTDLPRSTHN